MVGDRGQTDQSLCLQKFWLYETRSKFYMIGRDKNRTVWRVLKIDRTEPSELNIFEDPTNYTKDEYYDLKRRLNEGNMSNGGLRFVTNCYGIAGFVKFLGPYYMLLIIERRKIGVICGHIVYTVSKSKMIALANSTMQPNMTYFKAESRYKKLLCTVDLTRDFFFSYSYHIMYSLQRNLCDGETGPLYETMFVWNEYLTREVRKHLKSTMWTVALVYGFFKQAKLTVAKKEFNLTLIARRSRHFAGTRFLRRGVDEKGRVANDVETEQIVFEDSDAGGIPTQISSAVQHRGSIPLFWSQESSWYNMRPDIALQKDQNYEVTRVHFENLVKRYGNLIVVLDLIKTREKKPRETILREEFGKSIDYINKNLPKDSWLKFMHWDLNKYYKRKPADVLPMLGEVAEYALDLTGFFYCQVPPALRLQGALARPFLVKDDAAQWSSNCQYISTHNAVGSQEDTVEISGVRVSPLDKSENENSFSSELPMVQKGVLRTNCIDCLDRTNIAQYAYGLTALAHQLYAMGFIDVPQIDLHTQLAVELMHFYEKMGDTVALQYGGSAAHNKIFRRKRSQLKAITRYQEFLRVIQRYYSNAYMDAEKQDAINVFLGHFQPQQGKPALWELDSHQHYNIGRRGHTIADENSRSFIKRSLSDGNIQYEDCNPVSSCHVGEVGIENSAPYSSVCENIYEEDSSAHENIYEEDLFRSTPEVFRCMSYISGIVACISYRCFRSVWLTCIFRSSLSDASTPCEHIEPVLSCDVGEGELVNSVLHAKILQRGDAPGPSDSTPEISTCESDIYYPSLTPVISRENLLTNSENELKLDASKGSGFMHFDWISSSGDSCEEEETYERSTLINFPVGNPSNENVHSFTPVIIRNPSENSIEVREATISELFYSAAETSKNKKFSRSFTDWVLHGDVFYY